MTIREKPRHSRAHLSVQDRATRPLSALSGWVLSASLLVAAALPVRADVPTRTDPAVFEETMDMSVDHKDWQALLQAYLEAGGEEGPNLFNYAGLAAHQADRDRLELYITQLEATKVDKLSRDEQFAFWANLYNAVTVRVVTDHYPVRSIRGINISPGLFSKGPWGAKLVTVAGEKLSLDDIEHKILRPGWGDPRVHYAVNCASIGCPNLPEKPFTGKTLEADLDAAARAYVNSPRGVSATGSGLVLSKIYDWYAEDFGASKTDLLAHIRLYANETLAATLDGGPRIRSYAYDWDLNETAAE